MAEGWLAISMDFELGWGAISNGRWRERERAGVYRRLRPAMRRLLAEIDALEMPLTWAAVGAMAGGDATDHLPDWRRREVAGFAHAEAATRDGRDLLDMVAGARAGHEIGSHTATHTRFDAPGLGDDGRRTELRLAARALAPWCAAPTSLVFPENAEGGRAALAEEGVACVRLAPHGWEGRGLAGRLGAPPESRLSRDAGLTLTTGTMFLHWPPRDPGGLRRRHALWRAHRALGVAARGGGVHLWLHPFNLTEVPGLLDALLSLARRAARLRDAGRLDLRRMRDLAP